MLFMRKSLFVPLLACCIFCTGMSKKPKFTISVHGEGAPEDNPRMIFPETIEGQQMIFKLLPEFSHSDIAAIHPFPAEDGSFGMTLKLDFRGTNALELATRTRPGELLLTKVNGYSCGLVTMDKPILDGIFTIWSGIPETVVLEMQKKYPDISNSRSASSGIDMTATTRKEKREALKNAKEAEKNKVKEAAEAAKAEAAGVQAPKPAKDDLPRGIPTGEIPLEGPPLTR
jgi:hypothetical protein